jgi:hypothetical protein
MSRADGTARDGRRKVAARHRRAGHWSAQPKPMLTSGKVNYEIGANTDATGFGGIAAVHRLAVKLELVDEIDEALELLKVHLPYHESDHVLNLAYNVLCGGTRLEDIERLRHDTAYMNALGADLIPDPTTAGDFCRRFADDDVVALSPLAGVPQMMEPRPSWQTGPGPPRISDRCSLRGESPRTPLPTAQVESRMDT